MVLAQGNSPAAPRGPTAAHSLRGGRGRPDRGRHAFGDPPGTIDHRRPRRVGDVPPRRSHRWWNDGDEPLEFEGFAGPAVDLDRYLQAVFDVINAGPPGRPPLFPLAHVALRHRHTQAVLIMPAPLQALFFRVIVAVGWILGRYRGTDWPGSPARCEGVPERAPADA